MVLLTNTNIIVDEFNYGKVRSSYNYIYFLSHMHSGIPNFLKVKTTTKGSLINGILGQSIAQ